MAASLLLRILSFVLAGVVIWPSALDAGGLSHEDRLASLWSGRFAFTEKGTPLVRIGIASGAERVSVASTDGAAVYLWPSSPEGEAEIVAGSGWSVRVLESRPLVVRWMVVLERLSGAAGADVLAARIATWRARGVEPKVIETGAVFGVRGAVLDTRTRLLCLDGSNDREEAVALEKDAVRRLRIAGGLHPHVERPAGGTLEVRSKDGAVLAIVADAVWFGVDAAGARMLTLSVAGRFDARPYRGGLYVTFGRDGRLVVVNTVDAEEMLFGLVPAETYAGAPLEALKTQAVTARGHLISKIGNVHGGDPFLLCSETHCQVYSGARVEVERASRAVLATRGDVLFGDTALVPSYYSASCGGFSESCETVWDRPASPYLRGRFDGPRRGASPLTSLDPTRVLEKGFTEEVLRRFLTATPPAWCGGTRWSKSSFRWKVSRSAEKLAKLVNARHSGVGSVKDLRVLGRGAGGRITSIAIEGTKRRVVVERELPVRRLLGGLKSGLFVVDADRDREGRLRALTFTGGGFGHGVGLCQLGAIGMAEAGHRYDEILAHYYGKAEVRRLY